MLLSFINYLIMGLTEEWETFKTTLRGTSRSPSSTEDHILATIRDEDVVQLRKTESERVYATNYHPKRKNKGSSSGSDRQTLHCSYCDKDGHTASKCWYKPPYYCPKCKTKGHTLKDCSEKGKKSNPRGNTSKGKGKSAKQKHKREEEDDEEEGEQSMIMLSPPVTKIGTPID